MKETKVNYVNLNNNVREQLSIELAVIFLIGASAKNQSAFLTDKNGRIIARA